MDGRQRAARAVAARRGELDMTQKELAAAAGVDIKTIGNLESRGRWPIARSRARIEKALGWAAGRLDQIAAESESPGIVAEDDWEQAILGDPNLPASEKRTMILRARRIRTEIYPGGHAPGTAPQQHRQRPESAAG